MSQVDSVLNCMWTSCRSLYCKYFPFCHSHYSIRSLKGGLKKIETAGQGPNPTILFKKENAIRILRKTDDPYKALHLADWRYSELLLTTSTSDCISIQAIVNELHAPSCSQLGNNPKYIGRSVLQIVGSTISFCKFDGCC